MPPRYRSVEAAGIGIMKVNSTDQDGKPVEIELEPVRDGELSAETTEESTAQEALMFLASRLPPVKK